MTTQFFAAAPFEIATDNGVFAYGEGQPVDVQVTEKGEVFVRAERKVEGKAEDEPGKGNKPDGGDGGDGDDRPDAGGAGGDGEFESVEIAFADRAMAETLWGVLVADEELAEHADMAEFDPVKAMAETGLTAEQVVAWSAQLDLREMPNDGVTRRRARVIRGGKALTLMLPVRRRRKILSSRQRAALRRASMAARSSRSKALRARSFKLRSRLNLDSTSRSLIDRGFMESTAADKFEANLRDAIRVGFGVTRLSVEEDRRVRLQLKDEGDLDRIKALAAAHLMGEVAVDEATVGKVEIAPPTPAPLTEAKAVFDQLLAG